MIMNKKFSTLMALALVAGSVSAQNWKDQTNATVQGAYRTFETKSAPSDHTDNILLLLLALGLKMSILLIVTCIISWK